MSKEISEVFNQKETNRKILAHKRSLYMDNKISHREYYLWLADFIGATIKMVPFTDKEIAASKDKHLNDLPLRIWDNQDYVIRQLAYNKGLAWSLSDTVCVLKALARG